VGGQQHRVFIHDLDKDEKRLPAKKTIAGLLARFWQNFQTQTKPTCLLHNLSNPKTFGTDQSVPRH